MATIENLIEETDYRKEIENLVTVLLSGKAKQKTIARFFQENDILVCQALLITLFLKQFEKIKGEERRDRLSFYISYATILYKRKLRK